MSLVAEVTMQINVTRMSLKCTINVVIPLPLMSLNPMEIPRQFAIIYSMMKGVMLMHILLSLLILMLPAECWSKDHPSTHANELNSHNT